VSEGGIHVDFDGTSPASRFGINVPLSYTLAYTAFGLGCIVAADIPNNAGSLAPLTVSAPEGCILNAPFPAPVSSRHITGQMLPDVVFGCLRHAVPDRVPAEGTSCLWNITLRGPVRGSNRGDYGFAITMTSNGGTGARPMKDGLSATAYPSGVKGTPVEITESVAPVVIWKKELRPDSGGAGRYRGGMGQVIEFENAQEMNMDLLAAFDRIDNPPRGALGGINGSPGYVGLSTGERLRGKGFQKIPAGSRLVIHTSGGAGFGDPKSRAAEDVAQDLEQGLVSAEAARSVYGVEAAS
jgi:N-methylhydantoinase B